jgi:CheY-like chemotaxis protein
MTKNAYSPTVLIADDYDDVRPILRRWLEKFGCRVVEARDGREAVEVAKREHPDLILMDLSMPEVDGFAAALRIRKDQELRDVPIVAISAYGELGIDVQLQIDPQAIGFNEYVAKPFGPEQLEELLQRFIPHHPDTASDEAH